MPRLNLGDMQAVSRLGAALYSAPDLQGLCATILNDLPTLVAADRVSYNFINLAMNRLSAVTKPSELFPGALAAMNAHFRQHPVARRVKETAELRWLRISDVATQRA
jgi:hypothetical protein